MYIGLSFHNQRICKEFECQFEWLGENTEKYITLSEPINKEFKNGKTVAYKLKFIDSFRFISSSLTSLIDNYLNGFKIQKK